MSRLRTRRDTVYIGNEVSDTLFHFLRDRDYTKPWVEHREIKLTFVLLLCMVLNRQRLSTCQRINLFVDIRSSLSIVCSMFYHVEKHARRMKMLRNGKPRHDFLS